MRRWFLFLALTLELALALVVPDTSDLYRSPTARSLNCEMDPNTCSCGLNRQSGCEYDANSCSCLWEAHSEATSPASTNITSNARSQTETCVIDFSTCLCSYQPVTIPDLDVPSTTPRAACLTRSSTCECGWDNGVAAYAYKLFIKNTPNILSYQTCVTNYATCTCLAGVAVQPPDSMSQLLTILFELKATIESLLASPTFALKTLSVEQREKVVSEPAAVMIQLKELVGDDPTLWRLNDTEGDALVTRLRGEVDYLKQLSDDHGLLAAQLVETEQPIAQRLSAVVTALEDARRRKV